MTLRLGSLRVGIGSEAGRCANVPSTCVLKMMRRLESLREGMGSALGGCVDFVCACVLKMMLTYVIQLDTRKSR